MLCCYEASIPGKFSGPCGRLSRPWLWLPSRWAHDWAPVFLPLATGGKPAIIPSRFEKTWRGLRFRHPVGIAGGVDKTGASLKSWQTLDAGFLEVGTVTPKAQAPNSGKIMARSLNNWALWNKMGFPSGGIEPVQKNLQKFKPGKAVPLFVNIGKNRDTSNEKAHKDYIACMDGLHTFADAFVVNISSPNTKSLRALQSKEFLKDFLTPIVEHKKISCPKIPLLLKMSPDLDPKELETVLNVSVNLVDGWILTNTTRSRFEGSKFPAHDGGVSGLPLRKLSREILTQAIEILKSRREDKLIISAGGVMEASEVQLRLDLGADLVQSYSGLVFEGPQFFRKILAGLN